jgi:hypothetical protein
VDFDLTVVVNESELPEPVHKEARDAGLSEDENRS